MKFKRRARTFKRVKHKTNKRQDFFFIFKHNLMYLNIVFIERNNEYNELVH